jgi:hypothetical protein
MKSGLAPAASRLPAARPIDDDAKSMSITSTIYCIRLGKHDRQVINYN